MLFFTAEAGFVVRCAVVAGSALSLTALLASWRAFQTDGVDVMSSAWWIWLLVLLIVLTHIGIGMWTARLWTRGQGPPIWAVVVWVLLGLVSVPIHLFSWVISDGLAGNWKIRGPY